MSPERLFPEDSGLKDNRPTKESDCYALGMVIYEVLSGRVPFPQCNDVIVVTKVLKGEHPGKPQGEERAWFTVGLWGVLERCWKSQPQDRPNLNTVLLCLQDTTNSSGMFSPLHPDPAFNQPCAAIGQRTPWGGDAVLGSQVGSSGGEAPRAPRSISKSHLRAGGGLERHTICINHRETTYRGGREWR